MKNKSYIYSLNRNKLQLNAAFTLNGLTTRN